MESGEGVEPYTFRAGQFGGPLGREQHAQPLLHDLDRVQVTPGGALAQQADVEFPGAQGRHLLRGGHVPGFHPSFGIRVRECRQRAGQEPGGQFEWDAESQNGAAR